MSVTVAPGTARPWSSLTEPATVPAGSMGTRRLSPAPPPHDTRSPVHWQDQAEGVSRRDGLDLRRLQIDGAGISQLHRPVRDDAQTLALGGGRRIFDHQEAFAIR